MKKNSRKKIAVLTLFAVLVITFLPYAAVVHAADTPANTSQTPSPLACATNPPEGCIYYASYVLDSFLGAFITMGAATIKLGLVMDENVFNSATVQTGFSVALALANLAFVLGIIVIALATIVRSQTYGIKQLLWKLVVMAILVNFGLVITGPIIGFANNLSNYFVNATGGADGFVTSLTAAFAPHTLLNPPEKQGVGAGQTTACGIFNVAAAVGTSPDQSICNFIVNLAKGDPTGASDVFQAMMALLFAAVFETIVLITFWTIGITLIIRYVYIAILLILLPLAWLTWVFPKFSHHFEEWWSTFLKWAFFPAITLFFIYLAFQSIAVNGQGNIVIPQAAIQATGINGPEFAVSFITGSVSLVQTALDEILLCALCIGGLMAANKLGIKGSNTIVDGAKWAGGKVTGAVTGAAKAGGKAGWKYGSRAVGDRIRTAGRQYNPATRETTTALQRLGSSLQGVPIIRQFGAKLANKTAPTAVHEDRKEDIKKYVDENLKNLDAGGLLARANSATAFLSPTSAAAIGQELGKRNLTDKIDPALLKQFLEVSERMGTDQAILNNRPELAAETSAANPRFDAALGRMETAAEAVSRAITSAVRKIKVADAAEINHRSLGDYANPTKVPTAEQQMISLNISNPQLGKLGAEGSTEQIEAFRNTIRQVFDAASAPGAAPLPPDQQRNLTRVLEYLDNSPIWQKI